MRYLRVDHRQLSVLLQTCAKFLEVLHFQKVNVMQQQVFAGMQSTNVAIVSRGDDERNALNIVEFGKSPHERQALRHAQSVFENNIYLSRRWYLPLYV